MFNKVARATGTLIKVYHSHVVAFSCFPMGCHVLKGFTIPLWPLQLFSMLYHALTMPIAYIIQPHPNWICMLHVWLYTCTQALCLPFWLLTGRSLLQDQGLSLFWLLTGSSIYTFKEEEKSNKNTARKLLAIK